MKSCPTCNRTFEDTFTFCLIDGSILSAPFDPSERRAASPRSSEPPPTEVINAPAPPSEPSAPLQSTIRAPAPEVPGFAQTPRADATHREISFRIPQTFRLALGARGILAALSILPWAFVLNGHLLWNLHSLFAGVLTLTAGISLFVKCKRGLFLILDAVIAAIVAVAFLMSSQWYYWTGTWPIVSGALLIGAAIEMRKHLTLTWLLLLAGAIFGIYTIAFYGSSQDGSLLAVQVSVYTRAATAFITGIVLAVFAFATRGKTVGSN